jgi:hypothetical protein
VYQRTGGADERRAPIVAARNDGSDVRVIAHGYSPRVSPNGRRVAYFKPRGSPGDLYTIGNRGRHRQLLVRGASDKAPVAWSPTERYLIVSSFGKPGAYIVDRREDRAKHISVGGGDLGGASFAPGGKEFVMCGLFVTAAELIVRDVVTGARKHVGTGCIPAWSQHGVAFERSRRLVLLKHFDEDAETLLNRDARPVAWSADGTRLLALETSSVAVQPVFIDLGPRRIRRVDDSLVPKDLSRDGKEILGEAGGDVVVRAPDGTLKALATGATTPSWTK